MKYFFAIILFLPLIVRSQNADVRGRIVDSTRTGLPSASVVLLNKEDSVMKSFAITNSKGEFQMSRVKSDEYILQVSYVGFQTLSMIQKIEADKNDLGDIQLNENSTLLDGVSVTADRIPILINGDTVEYNSAAFKTKPNATVEELLKKLPGVEVDQDGNIKAHGEDVNKVLVDGKEFFGDDPKIATKNLPADVVNKVQVFDKLSEMAEFTGVDDGERNKTINLALKEDKKKGYFGKVTGGYGSDERYVTKGNVNRFTKKMQLSALAGSNNTNEQNFTFQDYMNFSGGLGNMLSGSNGGLGVSLDQSTLGSSGQQNGINTSYSGGINFNYDFNKATELSLNYFYSGVSNRLLRESFRINFLNDETFDSGDTTSSKTRNYDHRANIKLKHTLKKGEDITLRSNIGYNTSNLNSINNSLTLNPEGVIRNSQFTLNDNERDGLNFTGSILYRRRFKKKGRSFTARFGTTLNSGDGVSLLMSDNRFFTEDTPSIEILNQQQEDSNEAFNYQGSVNYTEPLGKGRFLQFNYSRQNFNDDQQRKFYDIDGNGNLNPNEALSNSFIRDYIYDRPGANFLVTTKKTTLNVGVKAQNAQLDGTVTTSDQKISSSFQNVLPSLQWQYKFASSNRLSFNYSTNVQEPSLRQLQPVVDNSNPLIVYRGNPELRPEYSHNGRLNYTLFDSFSFTSLFVSLRGTITENRITNSTRIDDQLRQEVSPINIGEEYQAIGYFSFSTPLKFIGAKVNMIGNTFYNRSQLFINQERNTVKRTINSIDISLENRKKALFDLTVGGKLELNSTTYSNSAEQDQDFLNKVLYSDLSIEFLKTWNFSTSVDYRIFEGDDAFNEDLEIPLWGAEISNSFGKLRRLTAKLSVFDILDQNKGINRNSSFNYIQDQRVNALSRYFMFSLTYSLSAFGSDKQSGVIIKSSSSR
ncbi:MAG: TonB-dependent receptor [Bacteroidota bacterium]